MNKYKHPGFGKGWWYESERHRLAGLGLHTGTKLSPIRTFPPYPSAMHGMMFELLRPNKEFINLKGDRKKTISELKKQGWKLRYNYSENAYEAWRGKNYLYLNRTHYDKLEIDKAFIRDKDVGERLRKLFRHPYPLHEVLGTPLTSKKPR